MAISQAAFTLNDTLVKLSTTDLGIGQIMLVRGAFASALVVLLVWHLGDFRPPRTLLKPTVLARVVGEIGGTVFYLLALSHLPLANVVSVFQALPLVVTMSAALFFGDVVGPRRWTAIAAGFLGVLLIVRPGFEGFSAYSIYVLVCVAFCAFRDLATRNIPSDIPSSYISMLTAITVAICGGFLIPFSGGWKPMDVNLVLILAGAAILVLTGYQFIIQSMRVGDISFVAPFRYTALVWAIGYGILVFGNLPDLLTIIGSAIVVSSGIYSLYRERVVNKTKPITDSTGSAIAADGV
jgi:drug/metabolite transporter (DMT)-like permease